MEKQFQYPLLMNDVQDWKEKGSVCFFFTRYVWKYKSDIILIAMTDNV